MICFFRSLSFIKLLYLWSMVRPHNLYKNAQNLQGEKEIVVTWNHICCVRLSFFFLLVQQYWTILYGCVVAVTAVLAFVHSIYTIYYSIFGANKIRIRSEQMIDSNNSTVWPPKCTSRWISQRYRGLSSKHRARCPDSSQLRGRLLFSIHEFNNFTVLAAQMWRERPISILTKKFEIGQEIWWWEPF